jgi:ATP-binding cassette subfamily B protein
LDSTSEKIIQDAIRSISQEWKTTIVIAHRLSTIMDFDKIVVLNKWKIEEEWIHKELLKNKGTYYKLWSTQKGQE